MTMIDCHTPLDGDLLSEETQQWKLRAACRHENPDLFFPAGPGQDRNAKTICSHCHVTAACLWTAMLTEHNDTAGRYGVYGGLTATERHNLGTRTGATTIRARLTEALDEVAA